MAALTPASLAQRAERSMLTDDVIDAAVLSIDKVIASSEIRFGRNTIHVEIPEPAALACGGDRAAVERLLFSRIIRVYEERGYDTRILIQKSRAVLYLFFDVQHDPARARLLDKYISSRRVGDGAVTKRKGLLQDLRSGKAPLRTGIVDSEDAAS